jgi:hypothetical protein
MEFEYTNNKDYKCAFLINDFERLLYEKLIQDFL